MKETGNTLNDTEIDTLVIFRCSREIKSLELTCSGHYLTKSRPSNQNISFSFEKKNTSYPKQAFWNFFFGGGGGVGDVLRKIR